MDSAYRYAEVSMAAMKLETETVGALKLLKDLNLKEPIPLSEIQEDEQPQEEYNKDVRQV